MLKPVNKCIYVLPDAPMEKKGDLFLPPSDVKQSHGIVQASDSDLCKPGDLIAYTRFFPTTVRGVDMVIVDEKSLIGIDTEPEGSAKGRPVSTQAADRVVLARQTPSSLVQ